MGMRRMLFRLRLLFRLRFRARKSIVASSLLGYGYAD
jgi:hypothetical protein